MPGISNCRLRARRGCQSQKKKKKLRDNRSGVHAAAPKAPAVRLSSLRVVARVPRTRMRSRRSIRKRGGEKGEGRDGMHDLPSACWARLAAARPDRREGILANVCASVTARCQVGYGASGSCAQAGCWAKSGLWRTMQRGRLDAATRLIEPGTCMLGGSVCHALLQDIVPPCASPQRAKLRPRHAVDTVPFAFAFDAPAIWNKKKKK